MTKMAGRGKGKASMSFSMEQLGLSKGDMLSVHASASLLQPSPSYPMLDHKPLPIQVTTEMSYLVELKRDFTEYMRESSNNVQAVILNEDIERYYEDYEAIGYNRSEYESKYDWSRMPMELKSSRKRKIQQSVKPNKKRKIMETSNIENKLTELEKEESTQRLNTEEEVEDEEEDEDKNKEEEDVKDEEEIDEEMDHGTDYANDYFDTGENYYSEDDNDDGPVF